ncbi:hypothetical protein QOT17_004135 [Balamuthia mandrillaris]
MKEEENSVSSSSSLSPMVATMVLIQAEDELVLQLPHRLSLLQQTYWNVASLCAWGQPLEGERAEEEGDESWSLLRKQVQARQEEGLKVGPTQQEISSWTYFKEFFVAMWRVKRAAVLIHHHMKSGWAPAAVASDGTLGFSLDGNMLLERLCWLRNADHTFGEKLLKEYHQGSPLVFFCIAVSYLERTLGDLVFWKSQGRERVPRRLNDLLVHPVLLEIFGPDVIYLLRTVIGPPSGINLRNVCWHGFLSTHEFHGAWSSLLLCLVCSLGHFLSNQPSSSSSASAGSSKEAGKGGERKNKENEGGNDDEEEDDEESEIESMLSAFCKWRKQVEIDGERREASNNATKEKKGLGGTKKQQAKKGRLAKYQGVFLGHPRRMERMDKVWDDSMIALGSPRVSLLGMLPKSDLLELYSLFERSWFVLPQRVDLWKEATQEWFAIRQEQCKDDEEDTTTEVSEELLQHRHHRCLVLLLPQLEHGIRQVFVRVNNCPDRILTAEPATHYTTLDLLLSEKLEDGQPNLLCNEFGAPLMHALLDLFERAEGPRLRIKMNEHSPLAEKCLWWIEKRPYISFFHPVSFLHRKTLQCREAWISLNRLVEYDVNVFRIEQKQREDEHKKQRQRRAEPNETKQEGTQKIEKKKEEKKEEDEEIMSDRVNAIIEEAKSYLQTRFGVTPLLHHHDNRKNNKEKEEKDEEDEAANSGLALLPRKVHPSKYELCVIHLLHEVVSDCISIISQIEASYRELSDLAMHHKANNSQRRVFAKLQQYLPFFSQQMIPLFLTIIEETSFRLFDAAAAKEDRRKTEEATKEESQKNHSNSGDDFSKELFDFVGRTLTSMNENQWVKAKQLVLCWVGQATAEDSSFFSLISNRERLKFWNNAHHRLSFPSASSAS